MERHDTAVQDPASRLAVLRSDAYHIAAANADECVTNVLAFINEARNRGNRTVTERTK